MKAEFDEGAESGRLEYDGNDEEAEGGNWSTGNSSGTYWRSSFGDPWGGEFCLGETKGDCLTGLDCGIGIPEDAVGEGFQFCIWTTVVWTQL